ncbi:Retrovirus-related Pol polyprotein from type-1 retrotransposable element R1 4 [Amphibalanus amphitrite]|uniref:Retrovirus-related Pol polyprotein from type-1 retrotransposable element R1 4 n=1 Tax=Amphibalanus amphitrite TaxID=1232801 RepID=A0A6A4V4Z3_AMPAM|nr:Retrovirus-related Pol polyprotein from type-1 retrotransposable element R1 4 [Amphibalanus amphitrite]
MLAPTLYTLWAADLITALRSVPGTEIFMYADDTATLSSGATIEQAGRRAQQAADTISAWADRWKMRVAGEKTQALVLSQWARDASRLSIRVAGAEVTGGTTLRLLGVSFDRLLHFGAHCNELRKKVRPRTAHLRRMTGRRWGLTERQLRTVANGYVRGALEYAAGAWLPAASESHLTLVDRELRAAARVVTGCLASTPSHALMAEAGLPTAHMCRDIRAARQLALAASLPAGDPLRTLADSSPPRRLAATLGWRDRGPEMFARLSPGDEPLTIEERLHVSAPPWQDGGEVSFHLDVGPDGSRDRPPELRRRAAEERLESFPADATWIWSDGSAEEGVHRGGGGAPIVTPVGVTREVRVAAGRLCSSTRAELFALKAALEDLTSTPDRDTTRPIIICLDSKAALALLKNGPAAQRTPVAADIWKALQGISATGQPIQLQWVPAHCGLPLNERADGLAKEASALPQEDTPIDVTTVTRAAARSASARWREAWPDGWHKEIWGSRLPGPVEGEDRCSAIDVHQLRAGHWSCSEQYLHRIGRRPSPGCEQCGSVRCPAGGRAVPMG